MLTSDYDSTMSNSEPVRRPPDAVLDDWGNCLRNLCNKSTRSDRWPDLVQSDVRSIPIVHYVKNLQSDLNSMRHAPGIPDTMFGRRLEESVDVLSGVNKFVLWCVEAITLTGDGVNTDAIYRALGSSVKVQEIAKQSERGMKELLASVDNVHVLTGALKLFFRQLQNPLMNYDAYNKAFLAECPKEEMRLLVNDLPSTSRNTLSFLMSHLQEVSRHEDGNTIGIEGLAVVFGPILMLVSTNSQHMADDMKQQNRIVEFLITEYDTIFPQDGRRDALATIVLHQQLHSGHNDSSDDGLKNSNSTILNQGKPASDEYCPEVTIVDESDSYSDAVDEKNGTHVIQNIQHNMRSPTVDGNYNNEKEITISNDTNQRDYSTFRLHAPSVPERAERHILKKNSIVGISQPVPVHKSSPFTYKKNYNFNSDYNESSNSSEYPHIDLNIIPTLHQNFDSYRPVYDIQSETSTKQIPKNTPKKAPEVPPRSGYLHQNKDANVSYYTSRGAINAQHTKSDPDVSKQITDRRLARQPDSDTTSMSEQDSDSNSD